MPSLSRLLPFPHVLHILSPNLYPEQSLTSNLSLLGFSPFLPCLYLKHILSLYPLVTLSGVISCCPNQNYVKREYLEVRVITAC